MKRFKYPLRLHCCYKAVKMMAKKPREAVGMAPPWVNLDLQNCLDEFLYFSKSMVESPNHVYEEKKTDR